MDLSTFLNQRRPDWRHLEAILDRVEGSGLAVLDDDEAVEFGRLYRRAASDLNQAQAFVSGEATAQYLNDLVARCYLVIYAKTRVDVGAFVRHLVFGFPAAFRRYFGYFLLATALLALGTVFGFLASYFEPDVARAYLLPDMPTIKPGREGPLMSGGELAGFSAFLFTNNVTVTLTAFALGMTLGLGTAWLMFYNGVMMGALGAIFYEAGQMTAFATGILPHGVIEIPSALLGGAAGFVLASGLIRARPWPRLDELARTGKEALLLVSGCLPLLAAAALLEAGVARAPDWFLDSGVKLAVAAVVALLFAAYVLLLGWGKRPAHVGQAGKPDTAMQSGWKA
ncbi:MAG TPA: stage II sporulation protein M [Gemmataceae bacterium]|nr:stage II sporulation protein M [Gemmataceae bacterium]